jgi:AcrR family transcriptional regulator
VTGKRTAHERFPEVLAAAVRVFTQDGYRAAHMSDVAREAGLSEAALYRYVSGKESLFVLAIRHTLLLENLPAEHFPLRAPSLGQMIEETRVFVADAVPFGSLAAALAVPAADDPAAELEAIARELFVLESQTREAADMIERSARDLPELAALLNEGFRAPVIGALTDYLTSRVKRGQLRSTPDTAATARLFLETLTWFARHRFSDPYGVAIAPQAAEDTAVDAMLHALVPARYLGEDK